MPCALRHLRAACAQLLRRYYGSVRLRLRVEARRCRRQTPPPGLRQRSPQLRTPEEESPNHSGDYSRSYGLNSTPQRFLTRFNRSRDMRGFIAIRMMAAADGLNSCDSVGLSERCRCPAPGHVCWTEDSYRGCHGGRVPPRVHLISLWILTEEQEYSGMFL